MEIRGRIIQIFNAYGYDFVNNEMKDMDSLHFIEIIVAIENEFSMELPDEYLNYSVLKLSLLESLITNLLVE